ncbi:MAG: AmmeMemoRadiSam system protein A [Nanoarchaeota archaeon]|nr:AmmeMemoRadiSam system protein A [Nanoarchaeota archaeon]
MVSTESKKYLLKLSRNILNAFVKGQELPEAKNTTKELEETKASFVTLEEDGKLRGCIGNIIATGSLYASVIDNTINAASRDPRFEPVRENELDKIKIKISILTEPKELKFEDSDELLEKIEKGRHGVILSDGIHSATFLPSVWEMIESKEMFLTQLCFKAGMLPDAWKKKKLKIELYEAEGFGEQLI